ncbi:MAG: FkbM family methyltransferase [Candidatus Helarchaeota archaeon]
MSFKKYSSLQIDKYPYDEEARKFCNDFFHGAMPKFILGINEYAADISKKVEVDGFIDEFTTEKEYLGKPIIHSLKDLPKKSLVVSAVTMATTTANKKLSKLGVRYLDYFRFRIYSGLKLIQVKCHFHDDFVNDFNINRRKYEWIYSLLEDEESRRIFTKIANFRLSNDLKYMRGFVFSPEIQYFEDFLKLNSEGEVFIDVGSFDGYTCLEFIKRCPNYDEIHVFEPDPRNFNKVKERLKKFNNIFYHNYGLSNKAQNLRINSQGSSSYISFNGDIRIEVKRLDDVLKGPITFIKMDIEGWEAFALEGAKQTIIKNHPRLAICVYHRFDDFWRIPKQVMAYWDKYHILQNCLFGNY